MQKWFILHGWGGNSQENWFPWLKEQQERKGDTVFVPNFPNAAFPKYEEWRAHWEKLYAPQVDKKSVLIGHSLGGGFLLRWLSKSHTPIQRLILVAPTPDDCGIEEIKDFFTQPLNFEQIKQNTSRIEILGSDNDPYIPLEKFERLIEQLGARFILCSGQGHLNGDTLEGIKKKTVK